MKLNFIYKHYEKIIIMATLVIFIFSLIWLINLFHDIYQEKPKDIIIQADKIPYKPLKREKYNAITIVQDSKIIQQSKKRNLNPNTLDYIITFTDFMVPFEIARSNAPGANNKLIPYAYYKKGICPITNKPISTNQAVIGQTDVLDTDKDNIPDAVEKQHNMNPKNPEDAFSDVDNDGFSNIDEYYHNSQGISESKIHPNLINRFVLLKISTTRIPLILKKVIKHGDNKKNWIVQINYKRADNQWGTKFLKIGNSIEINDMKYTIESIQKKTTEILDPRLGTMINKDISEVILYNSLNEQVSAQKDQWVYEPNRKITLKDLYTNKTIFTKLGSFITLGNKDSGLEVYKITAIGNNSKSIEVERNGKKFIVREESTYKPPIKSAIMFNNALFQTLKSEKTNVEKN